MSAMRFAATIAMCAVIPLAVLCTPALDAAEEPDDATLTQIARLVEDNFYSREVLRERDWPELVARARERLATPHSPVAREAVLAELVAALRTSHTVYLPRRDPRHADVAAIFEPVLALPDRACAADVALPSPLVVDTIGVWWRHVDGAWFVGGVLDGAPAQKAGIQLGDEIVRADGAAFEPVSAFAGRAGKPVKLAYRRTRSGELGELLVTPQRVAPMSAYGDATRQSARIIERDGKRIAYLHLWSGVGDRVLGDLHDAIRTLNGQGAEAFIVDFRDGWGGAPAELASIFDTRVPIVGTTTREGETLSFDGQIRVPAVVLINDGVRSGKETFAFAVRKHKLATLLGTPTAGAMLSGTVYCLRDGALLYLAVGTPTIDGEVLEGRPTSPDIAVPFDVRYAAGHDAQLDAALTYLAGKLVRDAPSPVKSAPSRAQD